MKIEVATEADVEQLTQLILTCYGSQESKKGWTSQADLVGGCRTNPEALRKEMSSPNLSVFKGTDEDSGKMIACAFGDRQGDTMNVGMLCVQPDIQGKGIGRQMMNAVEDRARKLNCRKMKIEVISTRKELVGWYERQGFQRNGKVEPYPEPTVGVGIAKVPMLELMEMERVID